jgi:hypothetical protein
MHKIFKLSTKKKFDLQLRKYKHNLIGFESRDNK